MHQRKIYPICMYIVSFPVINNNELTYLVESFVIMSLVISTYQIQMHVVAKLIFIYSILCLERAGSSCRVQ